MTRRCLLPALSMTALVAGCAAQGPFPSLAPRAVERLSNDEPVRLPVIVAADPELSARIGSLLAKARKGQAEFAAALPSVRARVSGAGAAASESWIEAQQALSRLEAARADTVTALAEIDRLGIDRAALPTNAGDYQALLGALETAAGLAAAQQAEIDRLRNALRGV